MMNLDEAIEILKEEYEKANQLPWVWSPIAYAMYQAWKQLIQRKGEGKDD